MLTKSATVLTEIPTAKYSTVLIALSVTVYNTLRTVDTLSFQYLLLYVSKRL